MGRVSGLTIAGIIKERRRRMIPADNHQHEIITYTIIDEYNTLYFVDDFQPDKYYEIGHSVVLPVYIKTYIKRNSQPAYTVCTRKDYQTRGEIF